MYLTKPKTTFIGFTIGIIVVFSLSWYFWQENQQPAGEEKLITQNQDQIAVSTQGQQLDNQNSDKLDNEYKDTSTGTVILTVTSSGGLCASNTPCSNTITIYSDGFYTDSNHTLSQHSGRLTKGQIQTLQDQIAKTDFTVIKSKPFNGVCPRAYDGQEITYYFSDSKETLASCTYDINLDTEPFRTIQNTLELIFNARTEKITRL